MKVLFSILAATAMFLSSAMVSSGQQVMIDDFSSNPAKNWRFFADTVMGGVSSGQIEFKTVDGVSYAQLSGKVSTANNGGFIQMRHELRSRPSASTKGVRLMVRGNNQRYYIHLRTSGTLLPWQYYQAGFDAAPQWQEINLPLSAFKGSSSLLREVPKATSVKSVAIVAFGKDYDANVEVREIGLY